MSKLAVSLRDAATEAWIASQQTIDRMECVRLNRLAEMLTAEANDIESMHRKSA